MTIVVVILCLQSLRVSRNAVCHIGFGCMWAKRMSQQPCWLGTNVCKILYLFAYILDMSSVAAVELFLRLH